MYINLKRNGSAVFLRSRGEICMMENQFIEEQNRMLSKIQLENRVDIGQLQYIAGVDLAYWKETKEESHQNGLSSEEVEYAVCCIVVLDYHTKEMVEKKYCKGQIVVPYIPGCLAFREIELVLETVKLLEHTIDLYVFDGNGYLHPRHMGLATHAGIMLDRPSIGVAKSYFKIENIVYTEPDNEAFSYSDLMIGDKVYGRVLRTHKNVKPIFLSIGHQIDLNTATEIVKNLVEKDSHIPIPTRYADLMTHEMRRQYQKCEAP